MIKLYQRILKLAGSICFIPVPVPVENPLRKIRFTKPFRIWHFLDFRIQLNTSFVGFLI